MKKRSAAILLLAFALAGCGGGDDDAQVSVGAATLKQSGDAWGKLTPVQKKTVVAYCLPPQAVALSPTRVAAAINRLYAAAPGGGSQIGVACTQAVKQIRSVAQIRRPGTNKRVARAANALIEFCPDDPQFLDPKGVARLTERLAVAYEQSPDRAKDRKSVEGAVAKLKGGCGPSARLQRALKAPAKTPIQPAVSSGGARTLTGNGPRELGNLTVSKSSDLRWARGGESAYFSVTEEQGRLSFLSEAPRGYRGVPAGIYRDVWVETDGPWTIVITPRYPSTSR
jgi:hypothetical protein